MPVASGNLMTLATWADFELSVEFWTENSKANSGIYFRCAEGTAAAGCYEVNLAESAKYRGAIRRLRFDPVETGGPGDSVVVEYISATRP